MKVNDSINNKVDLSLDKTQSDKGAHKASNQSQDVANGAAKSSDSVTLSPISVKLQAIQANNATAEVFDADKVDAIKSAIATGQFKVDSDKVANGLIDTVKDLLKTK
jgi:negative regulator of flagellin synthesis FlgM